MPKFIIEREIPGLSTMTDQQLRVTAAKSVGVLRDLGPEIQWVHSYIAGNKMYCIYVAPDEETIREHGRLGGFPVTKVARIANVIDPTTAER